MTRMSTRVTLKGALAVLVACPFGEVVPQWDFHADAGCWEHSGPDGWTRQQYQQPSSCLIDASTGQNGCARCVAITVCH
jgi:hypothetical protein